MNMMKTRREFLYDFSVLSCVILFSDPLVKKWMSPGHNLGCFNFGCKVCQEEQINVCYLGVGRTGMGGGEKLSAYVGANIQFAKLFENDVWTSPLNDESWLQMLEIHLQKQDIVVLVGKVDDPAFSDLRQFVIPRVPYLWTIGILSETFEMDRLDFHHEPKEILRLVSSSSSVFKNAESFIQSIIAIYLVQHKYIHDDDFRNICMEAFCELGI
jgi:hypothetical protein